MFAGWLLGQSFANRTSLGIAFPQVLYAKLLEGQDFKVGHYAYELSRYSDLADSLVTFLIMLTQLCMDYR